MRVCLSAPVIFVNAISLEHHPAIVSKVHEDGSVRLSVFGPDNDYKVNAKESADAAPGTWHWPTGE